MHWTRSKPNTHWSNETFETLFPQRLEKTPPTQTPTTPPSRGCNESTPRLSSSKIKDGQLKSVNAKIKTKWQNDSINSRATQSRLSRQETRRQSGLQRLHNSPAADTQSISRWQQSHQEKHLGLFHLSQSHSRSGTGWSHDAQLEVTFLTQTPFKIKWFAVLKNQTHFGQFKGKTDNFSRFVWWTLAVGRGLGGRGCHTERHQKANKGAD